LKPPNLDPHRTEQKTLKAFHHEDTKNTKFFFLRIIVVNKILFWMQIKMKNIKSSFLLCYTFGKFINGNNVTDDDNIAKIYTTSK